MPIPTKYLADFEDGKIYHVFKRTNNNERLFINEDNHRFFLKKYTQYLSPYTDTLAWCLLTNHFHLLIRVKSTELITNYLSSQDTHAVSTTEKRFLSGLITLSELIESAFKRFFQSYALAFNKVHNRKGNLFYKPFKRLEVANDSHFTSVVVYIHTNPRKHKIVTDFRTWRWSSYQSYLHDLENESHADIVEWLGGKEQFVKMHEDVLEESSDYIIEE